MQAKNADSPSSVGAAAQKSPVRLGTAFVTPVAVATIGTLVLCSKADPFFAGLFFVPLAFGPLAITAGLACVWRSKTAQHLLTISSILYAAWFVYVYAQAVYIHPDPQSLIAFLLVGIYALPVLAVCWLAAGAMHWWTKT